MAAQRGFKAVSLESLTDEQLDANVLSNWHKLNSALKHGQPIAVLRRLLVLELSRGSSARPNIAERVRAALFRAMTQRAADGLQEAMALAMNPERTKEDEDALIDALTSAGLDAQDADAVLAKIKESE